MVIFNYKYHLLFSLMVLTLIGKYYPIYITIYSVITCLLVFSWPDIDHLHSKQSHKHPLISKIVRFFFKKRGFTHSLVALFIVYNIFLAIELALPIKGLAMGALIGYGSHLFSDMFTPEGIKIFWPIPVKITIPILNKSKFITGLLFILTYVYFIAK